MQAHGRYLLFYCTNSTSILTILTPKQQIMLDLSLDIVQHPTRM